MIDQRASNRPANGTRAPRTTGAVFVCLAGHHLTPAIHHGHDAGRVTDPHSKYDGPALASRWSVPAQRLANAGPFSAKIQALMIDARQ